MTTISNVRSVRHVVMSVFINSISRLFNSAFCCAALSISSDISIPVTFRFGLCANMQSDTPPLPIPTSSTVLPVVGANAASHTASDVGL